MCDDDSSALAIRCKLTIYSSFKAVVRYEFVVHGWMKKMFRVIPPADLGGA